MPNRIARDGETEYASIYRRRSGQDAGELEYGINVSAVDELCETDKQELSKVVSQLAKQLERYTT